MFANLLIGLREGLEAALVVGILVAYLVLSDRRDQLRALWVGVALALAASVAIWAVITFTARDLSHTGQEVFAGVLSVVAVGFVTWMILWMRRAARTMRRELDGRLDKALVAGSGAVMATAFFAVAREGVETSLFLWSAMRASGDGAGPAAGAFTGLAVAVLLGYLIYRGSLRINLGTFFTWTGAGLILVAGWVLYYGLHEILESGVLPEVEGLAVIAGVGYVAAMVYLFFRGGSRPPAGGARGPGGDRARVEAPGHGTTRDGAAASRGVVDPAQSSTTTGIS
jgi:high-affinity iron transporter